jgi:uncharacterized repeat protein (TIGR01451 family)
MNMTEATVFRTEYVTRKLRIYICFLFFVSLLLSGRANAQPSFPCSSKLYLSNGTNLYEYSVNGEENLLFSVGNINALGFSTSGLLWAYDQMAQTVVIIGADGSKIPIAVPGLPTGVNYNVGTVDANGYYYLYDGQQAARFYVIDTDPSRSTYGKLVDPSNGYNEDMRSPTGTVISPTALVNRRTISDWTVNPTDGKLYTMTNSLSVRPHRLIRYDPITGHLEEVGNQIAGAGIQGNVSYGAIFIDHTGQIFVFGNTAGHLYSINPSTSSALQISENSISSSNIDGATCITSTTSILEPAIALIKTGVLSSDGNTITYTFTVKNTGNVDLNPVVVTDPKLTPATVTLLASSLEVGEETTGTATYTVTAEEKEAGVVENTAMATGTPPTGDNVTDISGTDQENDIPTVVSIPKCPKDVKCIGNTKATKIR